MEGGCYDDSYESGRKDFVMSNDLGQHNRMIPIVM